ncbi:MAG: hypothetical protein KAT53_04925 [Dehalococcoidia bacterium]|nr:hypothetical protein [Dehalococcoidia bacterium]
MLRMIKVCPRCGGNMLLNNDLYGWYEQCLQCSYLRDLDDIFRVKEQPMEQVEKSELAQYWEDKY